MLFRQIKISQVKCNFCMQWMSLNTEIRYHINVCDTCLDQGMTQGNLRAVSTKGDLYKLYMVKQNSVVQHSSIQRTTQSWFNDCQQQKVSTDDDQTEKTEFLQQIDEYRNTEIKDIVSKWNMLTSFLKQKETLSNEQINYLKKICSQKCSDFRRINDQFAVLVTLPKQCRSSVAQEFNIIEQAININENINDNIVSNSIENDQTFNPFAITIGDIQINSYSPKSKKIKSIQQVITQEEFICKSPIRQALQQKDLNCLNVISLCKLKNLNQNNQTIGKSSNISFYDDESSINSSCVKTSSILNHSQAKSFRSSSIMNSLTKRSNRQQYKKFQIIKNRITNYLVRNYQSDSLSRLMFSVVFEAYENTSLVGKSLQLISYNLSFIDFKCYLQAIDWNGIQVVKLVKTKLTDDQFKILIDFIVTNKLKIQILVLTGNKLSQNSIQYLYDSNIDQVKQIYLGKNRIMKGKIREKINSVRNKYSLYL